MTETEMRGNHRLLAGRVALVTASSRYTGAVIAATFARAGARAAVQNLGMIFRDKLLPSWRNRTIEELLT